PIHFIDPSGLSGDWWEEVGKWEEPTEEIGWEDDTVIRNPLNRDDIEETFKELEEVLDEEEVLADAYVMEATVDEGITEAETLAGDLLAGSEAGFAAIELPAVGAASAVGYGVGTGLVYLFPGLGDWGADLYDALHPLNAPEPPGDPNQPGG